MPNKIYVTLDYELFFGSATGSVQKSMIEPTARLLEIAERHRVAYTFFVDAGMLYAMERDGHEPAVVRELALIKQQLRELQATGHSLQLHVHPHWEDMRFEDGNWRCNTSRYRLDQFSDEEIGRIVGQYRASLEAVIGQKVRAFRAGGWCIQPFSRLRPALKENGITVDSTLYRDGYMSTPTHQYDFRGMPRLASWKFEHDPMVPDGEGHFTEIPISATRYSRWFYLKMVFNRLLKNPRYRFLGDGKPIGGGRWGPLRLVLKGDVGVVSLDGFRVRRLNPSLAEYDAHHDNGHFVALGHPKAFCDQTFIEVERMAKANAARFAVM